MIQQSKKCTYEEFLQITNDIERVEYIDGDIYYLAYPSPDLQRMIQ